MGLGALRQIFQTNIDVQVNTVAERGGVLSIVSGATVGVTVGAYAANPSGAKPIGILLDDVESMNFATHPEYRQRNVVDIGNVVGIVTKGEVQTDFIPSDLTTIAAGDPAYLYTNGNVVTRAYVIARGGQVQDGTNTSASAVAKVGRFLSPEDSNGFVKLYIEAV